MLALIVAGFIIAAFWAVRSGASVKRQVPVLLATANLPAYHALTSADITLGVRPARAGQTYATLPIEGRLTLRAVKKGEPIVSTDVSPDVSSVLGTSFAVTGIQVPRAAALGGALSAGDQVQLVLTRQNHRLASLSAVVLSVGPNGSGENNWLLVVALKAEDVRKYGWLFTKADVVVLLNPAARVSP